MVHVPLSHIVPDLLLTDLPKEFIVNTSQLDFDPKEPSTRLGRGGAGRIMHMYIMSDDRLYSSIVLHKLHKIGRF